VLVDNASGASKVNARQRASLQILAIRTMGGTREVLATGAKVLVVKVGTSKGTRIRLAFRCVIGTNNGISEIGTAENARVGNTFSKIHRTQVAPVRVGASASAGILLTGLLIHTEDGIIGVRTACVARDLRAINTEIIIVRIGAAVETRIVLARRANLAISRFGTSFEARIL